MKPQELRAGNWVHSDGAPFQIEPHNLIDIEKSCTEPIDLTKDWLKQFGFKGRKGLVWNHSVAIQILGDQFFFAAKDRGGAYYQSLVQVKHVHHLQNLYFDITGEELTIKNQL